MSSSVSCQHHFQQHQTFVMMKMRLLIITLMSLLNLLLCCQCSTLVPGLVMLLSAPSSVHNIKCYIDTQGIPVEDAPVIIAEFKVGFICNAQFLQMKWLYPNVIWVKILCNKNTNWILSSPMSKKGPTTNQP